METWLLYHKFQKLGEKFSFKYWNKRQVVSVECDVYGDAVALDYYGLIYYNGSLYYANQCHGLHIDEAKVQRATKDDIKHGQRYTNATQVLCAFWHPRAHPLSNVLDGSEKNTDSILTKVLDYAVCINDATDRELLLFQVPYYIKVLRHHNLLP